MSPTQSDRISAAAILMRDISKASGYRLRPRQSKHGRRDVRIDVPNVRPDEADGIKARCRDAGFTEIKYSSGYLFAITESGA